MCLTLSNSVSNSSIWRSISLNRAISASAAAMEVAARLDWERVEEEVWAVSCVRPLLADSCIWLREEGGNCGGVVYGRAWGIWGRVANKRPMYFNSHYQFFPQWPPLTPQNASPIPLSSPHPVTIFPLPLQHYYSPRLPPDSCSRFPLHDPFLL